MRSRLLPPEESADALADHARRHPPAARLLVPFMGFPTPCGAEAFARAGRDVAMVRLESLGTAP